MSPQARHRYLKVGCKRFASIRSGRRARQVHYTVHTEKSNLNKIGASELYALNPPCYATEDKIGASKPYALNSPRRAHAACIRLSRLSPQHPSLFPSVACSRRIRRVSASHRSPLRVRTGLVRSVACPRSIRRLSPQHQLLSRVPCSLCCLTPPPSSIGCFNFVGCFNFLVPAASVA